MKDHKLKTILIFLGLAILMFAPLIHFVYEPFTRPMARWNFFGALVTVILYCFFPSGKRKEEFEREPTRIAEEHYNEISESEKRESETETVKWSNQEIQEFGTSETERETVVRKDRNRER